MKKNKQNDAKNIYRVGASLPSADKRKVQLDESEKPKKGKKTKKIVLIIVSILLLFGIFFGASIWNSIKDSINGSLFDLLTKNEPLKKDANGRTNIVIFGTSEDDEGHSGALLADSIMTISLDQTTKKAVMVSIPRDLWVKYNTDCNLGSEGKINASYSCALRENNNDVDKASQTFGNQVGEVVGLDVHYYIKINYTVVKDTVDALGGITVKIESSDPRGIYDVATKLKLPNGENQIDGETALNLSRARGSFGGYGLGQSNFDREKNQQAIVKGIVNKATSTGTITNVPKVLSTVSSLGDNIVTNVNSSEIKTALNVANGFDTNNIVTVQLNAKEKPLVTTGNYRGQSIVRPSAGVFDYLDIQKAIKDAITSQIPEPS